ncbi:MAG: hypothetical protein NVSMB4_09110 [Acidimicrobiales bacterium]
MRTHSSSPPRPLQAPQAQARDTRMITFDDFGHVISADTEELVSLYNTMVSAMADLAARVGQLECGAVR